MSARAARCTARSGYLVMDAGDGSPVRAERASCGVAGAQQRGLAVRAAAMAASRRSKPLRTSRRKRWSSLKT